MLQAARPASNQLIMIMFKFMIPVSGLIYAKQDDDDYVRNEEFFANKLS